MLCSSERSPCLPLNTTRITRHPLLQRLVPTANQFKQGSAPASQPGGRCGRPGGRSPGSKTRPSSSAAASELDVRPRSAAAAPPAAVSKPSRLSSDQVGSPALGPVSGIMGRSSGQDEQHASSGCMPHVLPRCHFVACIDDRRVESTAHARLARARGAASCV